jgi:hypothetical protein
MSKMVAAGCRVPQVSILGNYPIKASGHPSVKLADRILLALAGEDVREAVYALKIALMLLPIDRASIPSGTPQAPEESSAEVR